MALLALPTFILALQHIFVENKIYNKPSYIIQPKGIILVNQEF